MRGYRWAVEEPSFADMKRKVPDHGRQLALIERDMLKGPWVHVASRLCPPYAATQPFSRAPSRGRCRA
jgi:glutathione S-transferase